MGCTASTASNRCDQEPVCIQPVEDKKTAPSLQEQSQQPLLERRQTVWRRLSTIRRLVQAEPDEELPELEAQTRILIPVQHSFFRYYSLGRKIADGTSAQVRLCSNLVTKTECAVKIFPKSYCLEKFLVEVGLMKAACNGSCSNLVEFFDAFRDHRYLYLVMEYCRGEDLLTSIVKTTESMTEELLAKYIGQLLRALEHLHSRGILHRDIRPQNILMANSDSHEVKLIDLGSGCELNPFLQLSEACGIAYYFSPEMIEGVYDRKSDIWAAGVTLYLLLFGYRPFSGASDQELFRQILRTEPSYRSLGKFDHLPSTEAIAFCRRLLLKDAKSRPSADEALRDPWITRQAAVGRGGVLQQLPPYRYVPPESLIRISRAETLDLSSAELKGLRSHGRMSQGELGRRSGRLFSGLGSSVSHAMTRTFGAKASDSGDSCAPVATRTAADIPSATVCGLRVEGLERDSQAPSSVPVPIDGFGSDSEMYRWNFEAPGVEEEMFESEVDCTKSLVRKDRVSANSKRFGSLIMRRQ